MRRRPQPKSFALAAFALFSATALAEPPELSRALSWIPEDSVSFVVVPGIKRMSNDLAQLIEATGQGGALAMGRPIDILKAQLGIGANLDENGPLVAYFPPLSATTVEPAEAQPFPIVMVPVTDADAFIAANLTVAPDRGESAYTTSNGLFVFARKLEGRVALAPTRETLPAEAPARGIGERFLARLKGDEIAWLDRADLIAWASRDALHAAVEIARKAEIPAATREATPMALGGFAGDPAQQEVFRAKALEIADMLADGMIVVDVDPLGLFIASVGVGEPSTALAAVMAGGEGKSAAFDRLPQKDFYIAISASIDGLGGSGKFGELLDLTGISRTVLPDWFFTEGADINALQVAAYPSKLGVAIGGALNDSALFVGSRDPSRTLDRLRSGIEALAGESVGIRREPTWTAEKTLKSGDVVAAFEIKETVVDAAQRPGLDFERLAKQFIFGSRGVNGLAKKTADGVVVTFSQRPDVYARAVEAASTAKSLAADPTVQSIEEWLPASRDIEVMIGVGPLTNLVSQIASSFVSEEQIRTFVPKVAPGIEPVAAAIDLDGGRARTVLVLPAAVLKIAAQSSIDRASRPRPAPEGANP